MTLAAIFDNVQDTEGNAIQNAAVYVFARGTAVLSAPPSGTAVSGTLTNAAGLTINQSLSPGTANGPVVSDERGEWVLYCTAEQLVDVVIWDNNRQAFVAVNPDLRPAIPLEAKPLSFELAQGTGTTPTTIANDPLWQAKGDVAVGTAPSTATRLPLGSNGQVLTADSTQSTGVKWAAAGGGGGGSVGTDVIWDSKGDLAAGTGADTASKLVVGSNGQVLTADSTQTTGLKWTSPVAGSVAADVLWDSKGDLAVGTGADTASKLGVGSDGQILTADSTQTTGVKWASAASTAVNLQKGFTNVAVSGGAYTINCNAASYFRLDMASSGLNISAPTNTTNIFEFTLIIKNTSGGAITPNFNAAYHLADTFTAPAAGKLRTITFVFDGTDSVWREKCRSGDDIA